jgi:MFS transporter, DHA1 family, multidrug resistance protein
MAGEGRPGLSRLAPLYASIFVTVLGFSLVAPIFPRYVLGLGASYTLLGIIISSYGGIQLLTQVPIGRLSDRIGRKPLIMLGLLSFTVMPPLYIYATNAYELIPIRLIGGIGASAVWPLAMAMIIERVDPLQRGRAMGWYNAAFYSAMAIGPAIGGFLFDTMGLGAPFYFWALLGLTSMAVVYTVIKEPPRKEKISFSLELPKERMILKGYDLTFASCCGVVMWSGIVGGFYVTLLPSYASGIGLSTTQIGFLYMAYAGSTAICNVLFGRLADRGRRKLLISTGCIVGALSFALLPEAFGLISAMALLAALGAGAGISTPAAASLIADTTCSTRRGEIFGVFNTARMMGVVIGPIVAGLTADAYGIMGSIASFVAIAILIAIFTLTIRVPPPSPACTANNLSS